MGAVNKIALWGFGGLGAALVGLIGLEVSSADHATSLPIGSVTAPSSATAGSDDKIVAADHRDEQVSAILARPLLSSVRRPPATGGGPLATGLPRLSAVLISHAGRQAIFAGDAAGKPTVASVGSRIGLYTVQSISDGEVTVVGPEGIQQIHPSFADGTARPAPAPQHSILDQLLSRPANIGIPGLPTSASARAALHP